MNEILLLIVGVVFGSILTYGILAKQKKALQQNVNEQAQNAQTLETQSIIISEQNKFLNTENEKIRTEFRKIAEELSKTKISQATAETRLIEAQKNLAEQNTLLEKSTHQLTTVFKSLSADALNNNNESFLKLATQQLNGIIEKSKNEFGKQAITNTLTPLQEMLSRYEKDVKDLEKHRQEAYGSLHNQIHELTRTHEKLQQETTALVNVLKRPEVRGRWGELTLRNAVELAGMVAHCDFEEQVSVATDTGHLRPDLIVHLPEHHCIVVDAKAPLRPFIEAHEAETEHEREQAKQHYSQAIRTHMQQLSRKQYWDQFKMSPDFVVLFLPGESFFSAALELDHTLMEDALKSKVIIATPTTLIALLRTVAHTWKQQQLAENAQKIALAGTELYTRIQTFVTHLSKTGRLLNSTVDQFNKTVGSFNNRILPGARKLQQLGATNTAEEMSDISSIELTTREASTH